MKASIKIGIGFGLSSAIITILGLMVGLNAGTHSKAVILGAIVTIAIADSLADSLGVHISQESQKSINHKQVWESTIATAVSKFIVTITFILPVLLLPLFTAIIVSIVWGFFLLIYASYNIARERNKKPAGPIIEHLVIAIIVIILTYFVGRGINAFL